eukprot:m.36386 g.36386  ORF g.36386 m.36386 type:complete len:143 (+) comp9990_c1_seq2:1708-2136(+)
MFQSALAFTSGVNGFFVCFFVFVLFFDAAFLKNFSVLYAVVFCIVLVLLVWNQGVVTVTPTAELLQLSRLGGEGRGLNNHDLLVHAMCVHDPKAVFPRMPHTSQASLLSMLSFSTKLVFVCISYGYATPFTTQHLINNLLTA